MGMRESRKTLLVAFAYAAMLYLLGAPLWALVLGLLVVERTSKMQW